MFPLHSVQGQHDISVNQRVVQRKSASMQYMKISKIIEPVLNFFFPDVCVICGEDTDKNNLSVCRKCLNKIEFIKPPYCQTCFLPLADGGAHCWQCRRTKYHFEKIIAVGNTPVFCGDLFLNSKKKIF